MNKILIIDDDRELCALIKHSVQSEHIEAEVWMALKRWKKSAKRTACRF